MEVISELGHFAALLPLFACLFVVAEKRHLPMEALPLALVFLVSFFADSIGALLQAQGIQNTWLPYVYAPIQFAALAWILAGSRATRTVAVTGILLASLTSLLLGPYDRFETVVQVMGGAMIGVLVLAPSRLEPYRWAMLTYCVAVIPFLLFMGVFTPDAHGPWIVGWIGYQVLRVAGCALFTLALVRRPALKVIYGPGTGEAAAGQWGARTGSRGAHRHETAGKLSQKTG